MDTIRINLVYEMRLILFIILFQKILFAQDSLFWFDMSKVRDPVPKTPMVMDKIFGLSQFTMIDSLKKIKISTLDGYRLQLYESSSAEKANKKMNKYSLSLKDSLYLVFDAPLYKIRYGNYVTKNEADIEKNNLKKKGFRTAWVVKSRIEQIDLENNEK